MQLFSTNTSVLYVCYAYWSVIVALREANYTSRSLRIPADYDTGANQWRELLEMPPEFLTPGWRKLIFTFCISRLINISPRLGQYWLQEKYWCLTGRTTIAFDMICIVHKK